MTTDELFYKEFTQMMKQLRGINGNLDLKDIPLPPESVGHFLKENHDKVLINNISDEYYSSLNGCEALLWKNGALKRRKFDYQGKFLLNSEGKNIYEDVICHQDCYPIISDKKLGVPLSYKPKESFEYVDFVTKKVRDKTLVKYVYIIPKKYLYRINQTALVLSWNKLRVFYSSIRLSLQSGHYLFVSIIPYKPSNTFHNYRVLHCKTSTDYSAEIKMLNDFWLKQGIIFNPALCDLIDPVREQENMAYLILDGTLDNYVKFDSTKAMDTSEELEEVEFIDDFVPEEDVTVSSNGNDDDWGDW